MAKKLQKVVDHFLQYAIMFILRHREKEQQT